MSVSDAASPTQKCNTHVWEQNISLGMTYSEQTRGGSTPSPGPLEDGCSDSVLREEYLDRQQTIGIRESVKTKDESSVEYGRTQDRRSLSGTVYGPPIGAPPGHYKRPAPVGTPRLQINHTGGLNFKKGELNSVIEVLLDEPRISVPSRYRKNSVISTDSGRGSSLVELAMVQQNPKRIRIRSSALLKILETVAESAGHSFLTSGTVSLVFQYPFKLFCTLESHIRDRFSQMERELRIHSSLALRAGSSATDENTDIAALQHLRLLITLFDTDLKPMFDLRRAIESRKLTTIAFRDLWHLFDFGQNIRTHESESQVYRILRCSGGREPLAKHGLLADIQARATLDAQCSQKIENRGEIFIVDTVYFEFDGYQYGPVQKTFLIRKFEGERAITSLPVFPLIFDPRNEDIRNGLISRGELYLQLSQSDRASHKHYTGLTLDEPREEVDSQIIVDTRMALLKYYTTLPQVGIGNLVSHNIRETYEETVNPTVTDGICAEDGCCDNDPVHKDYSWDMQTEEVFFEEYKASLAPTANHQDIADEEKMLLPPLVYGFILRSRKWAKFDIRNIRNVEYTSGFDDLVLPCGHKETVRALVANHARQPPTGKNKSQNQDSIDLVRGKGKGLVILLHGAPGVGKTSTAECVADTTKRPLFPITCGDIGDNASEVEANLESSFQLAHKWGCVLLLDEADIFLQKRDKADIKRNAIVSVFLRALEYYSGILFLTTNRVGLFDPAFRSRIHISLYYPGLQKDATIQIWKMHLARIQEIKGSHLKIRTKDILRFAKDHYMDLKKAGSGSWNGRQIRNAFQTAIALAEFEATENSKDSHSSQTQPRVELSREHFATVAKASAEFDAYLRSTLGGQTEADVARLEQTRMDEYSSMRYNSDNTRSSKPKAKKGRKIRDETDSEDSIQDSEATSDPDDDEDDNSSESEGEKTVEVAAPKSKKESKRRK